MQNLTNPETKSGWGIYLLSEGIHETVFESQVLAHGRCLKEVGVNTEIWVFTLSPESLARSVRLWPIYSDQGIRINLIRGVRSEIPFSRFLNGKILARRLARAPSQLKFIHARTASAAAIAISAKRDRGVRIVWDSRGDTENEMLLQTIKWKPLKKLLIPLLLWHIRHDLAVVNRYADAGVFVSNALKELHCGSRLATRSAIIPCTADGTLFYFSEELRSLTRSALKIPDSDVVVLFSGSLAPWQCSPETVGLLSRLLEKNERLRAIVLSPDSQILQRTFDPKFHSRLILHSARMQEVNKFLNAADFGVLLRNKNSINHVASPVKFAEYCLAGLQVIMTDAVEQLVQYSSQLKNHVPYNFGEDLELPHRVSNTERLFIATQARALLERRAFVDDYLELYGFVSSRKRNRKISA